MSEPLRVFVTGGTKGIGRAVALRFAREGARVAIAARTSADLDAIVSEIESAGGRGEACQANLRDHGSLEAAVYRAVDFFEGGIDVLVNAAGLVEFSSFDEIDMETWERFIAVNLTGPYHVLAEALPALRESDRAHVFNIGAAMAETPTADSALMAATKAGLAGLGRALSADLAGDNIRVTTVLPGLTDTPGLEPWRTKFQGVTLLDPGTVADAIWDCYHADAPPLELNVGT
jgi:NAD(P)-dependent dehydrogenase (short-subunit alcohol dehydrogenase family)